MTSLIRILASTLRFATIVLAFAMVLGGNHHARTRVSGFHCSLFI